MSEVVDRQLTETLRLLAIAEGRIALALRDPSITPSVREALTAEPLRSDTGSPE